MNDAGPLEAALTMATGPACFLVVTDGSTPIPGPLPHRVSSLAALQTLLETSSEDPIALDGLLGTDVATRRALNANREWLVAQRRVFVFVERPGTDEALFVDMPDLRDVFRGVFRFTRPWFEDDHLFETFPQE